MGGADGCACVCVTAATQDSLAVARVRELRGYVDSRNDTARLLVKRKREHCRFVRTPPHRTHLTCSPNAHPHALTHTRANRRTLRSCVCNARVSGEGAPRERDQRCARESSTIDFAKAATRDHDDMS